MVNHTRTLDLQQIRRLWCTTSSRDRGRRGLMHIKRCRKQRKQARQKLHVKKVLLRYPSPGSRMANRGAPETQLLQETHQATCGAHPHLRYLPLSGHIHGLVTLTRADAVGGYLKSDKMLSSPRSRFGAAALPHTYLYLTLHTYLLSNLISYGAVVTGTSSRQRTFSTGAICHSHHGALQDDGYKS